MANFFDQFDAPSSSGNFFDQFDEKPEAPKPEGGLIASLASTAGQLVKGAGQAAADYLPGVTQDNALKSYGQEVIDANPTAVRSLSDVADSPWTATKEAVGNALGSMGAMVGAQALGRGVEAVAPFTGPARPIVSLLGKSIQFAGPVATAALPSYGGIREQQIQDDPTRADSPEAKARAVAGAGAVGLIERSFGPEKLALSAMTKEGRAKVIESMAGKSLAGSIGKGMAKGAAVEGAEELVQNPVEQFAGYQDPTTPENLQETAFGGVMGALGGGVLGGAGGGISYAARPEQPQVDPNAGPLSRAAATAQQTGAAGLAQAAQQAQAAEADTQAAQPDADPLAGLSARLTPEAMRAVRAAEGYGPESVNEVLRAYQIARNPELDPTIRQQATEALNGFWQGFDNRPNWTRPNPQPEQAPQPGTEVVPLGQGTDVAAPGAPSPFDPNTLDGEAQEVGTLPPDRPLLTGPEEVAQQYRRELLEEVLADPDTRNPLSRYESVLKKNGFEQRRATPDERKLIEDRTKPAEQERATLPPFSAVEQSQRAAFPMTQTGAQRQAAERTQATGQAFEVVPHPTVKGRFAVQAVAPVDQFRDAANMIPERVTQTPEIEQVADDGTQSRNAPLDTQAQGAAFQAGTVAQDQGAGGQSVLPRAGETASQSGVVPKPVRDRLSFALNRLQEIRKGIDDAVTLEKRFGSAGRYQADALTNRRQDIEKARKTLADFRRLAPNNGVDAEAVIAEMGGEPDFTPSKEAQAWLDSSRGATTNQQGTDNGTPSAQALAPTQERGTAQQAEVTNAAGSEQAVSDIAAARSPVGADSAVTGSAGVHADSGRGRPQGTPEGGAQEPGQGVGRTLEVRPSKLAAVAAHRALRKAYPEAQLEVTKQGDGWAVVDRTDDPFTDSPANAVEGAMGRLAQLQGMADAAGWSERGGKLLRDEGAEGEVTGRTKWLPTEAWFAGKPAGVTEQHMRSAVEKVASGRGILTKPERDGLAYMQETLRDLESQDRARQNEEASRTAELDALASEAAAELTEAEVEAIREQLAVQMESATQDDYLLALKEAFHEKAIQSRTGREAGQADARGARQGVPEGRGEGGREASAFSLESQTPQDLAARDAAQRETAEREQREQQERERKAQADAERGSFTLSGSDRPADVMAAQGQGGLFDAPAPTAANNGIRTFPGKGRISDKFLAELDGEGVPGGPWDTQDAAQEAAIEWRARKAERTAGEAETRRRKDALAAKLRDGGDVTEADLTLLGLRPGSSDLRWFIPAAADLFGISSRAVRPLINDMIRVGHTDMGAKREFVTPDKALKAMAEPRAEQGQQADTGADTGRTQFSRAEPSAKAKAKTRDAAYLDAVERGDMDEARKLVDQAARDAGYISGLEYRMQHQAPNSDGDVSIADVRDVDLVPDDYWTKPQWYQGTPEEMSAWHAVMGAFRRLDARKNEGKGVGLVGMTVYRAVPKNVKDDAPRNGDWVSPSLEYAKAEGAMIPEGYRIISHHALLKHLYWDGNSIAELGYDDGKGYAYKNTKNNRKLFDVVTRDDDGAVIPLSKRFNQRSDDPRYSFAGESARTADTHALATAQSRIAAGEDAETVRQETGWFRGADNRWRFEIDDSDAKLKPKFWTLRLAAMQGDTKQSYALATVLDHPKLFAAYPFLRQERVFITPDEKVGGMYDATGGDGFGIVEISTAAMDDADKALSIMLHEIQHGIQDKEGFAVGGSPDAFAAEGFAARDRANAAISEINAQLKDAAGTPRYAELLEARSQYVRAAQADSVDILDAANKKYRALAGEVESRNTQARQKLTAAERRATSPESTADVKASDVIVVFNGTEMASAPAPANAAPMEATGTTPDAIWSAVESLVGPLRRRRIIVVQSADVLVEQGILQSRDANGAQAFVKDGKAYFIAGNIQPGNERAVFLHEVGAHLGLERILSPLQRSVLLNRIKTWAAQANGSVESRIAQAAQRRVEAAGGQDADLETVAYFVEEAVKAGINPTTDTAGPIGQWFKTLWAALRTALEKLGLVNASKLTAQDIVDLAHGAANVAIGEDATGGGVQFSRAAANIAPVWDVPESSKLFNRFDKDSLIYTLQDKHVDTKRVVEAIRKQSGDIADEFNPYLQEELFHGRSAKGVKDFLDGELRPLLTEMSLRKVDMATLEKFLHARHAEERNIQIAKINPKMPDGGSGMETQEARDYLAALDPAQKALLDKLAAKIDAINASTRQLLVDAGLEKPETIKAWEGAYKHYVPLQREEVDSGGLGIGQGFSVKGSASKRAMGSDKAVADIIANIAMQRERAIVRAEKNRVSQALYALALKAPNPEFWMPINPAEAQAFTPKQQQTVIDELTSMGLDPADAMNFVKEPKQRYIDPRTGLVSERINPVMRSAPNVLATRINGEDRYVFFNAGDERANRMVHALKNLDADQLGRMLQTSAKLTRWFASVNTQYNPVFGAINLTRDVQGAILNLSTTPIRGQEAKVLANTFSALKGIYTDLRAIRKGGAASSQWAGLWEEFQKEGGQTGYRDMFSNATERAEAIQKELDQLGEGKLKAGGRALFDWLSDYNESMENAVRLAAYKAAKDQGISTQQAASIAKNLTVNFNRKGQITTQAGALYAFFNAAVQGTTRMAQTLNGPAGRKIILGGLTLGAMQAVLLAAAGFDDEDPPEFVRERSIIIPTGGGKYISTPMPLGFHVIPSTSRILTEWALSGFKHTPKRFSDVLSLFADTFNPIGNAGWSMQTLAPTALDPLAALAENRDWSGKPIAREDFNKMAPTPGYSRAKDTASWVSKTIAYWANLATGGTDYKPGMFSPTPDQLDYLIGQFTGGVGREYLKAEQTATSVWTGEDLPPHKIPLLGRFYGDTTGQSSEANRFYSNIKEVNQHKLEIDGRRKDGGDVGEYMRDNPTARLAMVTSRFDTTVRKLRQARRDAVERGDSQERIKALDAQMTNVMRQFNDQFARLDE